MKISQGDAILIKKISICQRGLVHGGCWVNFPRRVGKFEVSTLSSRKIRRTGTTDQQPGRGRL